MDLEQAPRVLPKSAIGQAIIYATNQWPALQVYLRDGRLTIDIYDSATRRPVWHGSATQEIHPDRVRQEMVDAMVDALLLRFPPQPRQPT